MHDLKYIRENPQDFDAALIRRGAAPVAASVLALDENRRAVLTEMQNGQARRNEASKAIGAAMGKAGYMKNKTTGVDIMAVGVDYNLSKTALLFADIGKTSNLANATWQVGVHKKF